jgi:hypothetical protein
MTTPGKVGAHGLKIHPLLTAAKRGKALRDPRGGSAVSEDLECHLESFEIVHRQQYGLGLTIPGQRDALML